MKKIFLTLLTAALAFSFFSCKNPFVQNNKQDKKSKDGQTYLVIGNTNIKKTSGRTASSGNLSPDSDDAKPENLTSFVLKGRQTESTVSEMEVLAEAENLASLKTKKIPIAASSWEFTLSAELNGILFSSGSVTKEIVEDTENSISFVLTSQVKYGGLEVTVEWVKDQNHDANKVVATLMDAAETQTIETKTFENFADDVHSVKYTRNISSEAQRLNSGTYYLSFKFYNEGTDVPLGYFDSYVNIADGLVTKSQITNLDLNQTFTIEYVANGGVLAEGQTQPLKYSSRSSEITLPTMKKPGFFWGGWYENENCEGEPVTAIPAGTGVQKTYWAKWKAPVLYVSHDGNDTNDGLTADTACKTIDGACEKIELLGDSKCDWVINITGSITGKATGTSGTALYAQSNIPDTVNPENAQSILLTGTSALVGGFPQDAIDRGLNDETTSRNSSNATGTALAISTSVPVMINNLKITKGNTDLSSYRYLGGGLRVSENSTVYLGDGAYFYNNVGYDGGAIYNAGNLYIYGTAFIGKLDNDKIAISYESAPNSANFGRYGGAIYNAGNLYIGYKKYVDETTNTPAEWTGQIRYNYSANGGAIFNAPNAHAVMRTGKLCYNASGSSGSGGGAIRNFGTFELTGDASVEYNKSNSTNGGGIYNGKDSTATGTFIFSGGTINNNFTADGGGNGGGIYTKGKLYIYGNAVIGDKDANFDAYGTDADECSNYARGYGGGICVDGGEVYLGYGDKKWTGGIYYNYAWGTSTYGGGGLAIRSSAATVVMNSGTIAYNGALGYGGAIHLLGNGLTIGGTAKIPAGEDNKQDIYFYNSYYINVSDSLSSVENGEICLTPSSDSDKTRYYNTQGIKRGTEEDLSDINQKFKITPLTRQKDGLVTQWEIGTDGIVKQKTVTLNVSASGNSFADVIPQMTNEKVDYVIVVDGTTTEPVTLPSTIKANSITIEGKNYSGATLKGSIESSSSTSPALSVETTSPVVLLGMLIKGGKGKTIGSDTDQKLAGGGIYIAERGFVTIDNYSKITENTSDVGAGIYVSANAKLYMDCQSQVTNNTATTMGAGVYVADSGYFRIIQASQCHVSYNKFATGTVQVMGGGVYLEDGATMEQFGGYIHNNEVNTSHTDGGLGSGVYVNSSASYKTLGYAQLSYQADDNVSNDIYLKGSAQIEIADSMNTAFTPRKVTPENYTENTSLFTFADKVTSNIIDYFEVTPETLGNGETQYWRFEKNTGNLLKSSGMGIAVSLPSGPQNDIQVQVTSGVTEVENNTHLTGGSTITFTASTGYSSYTWKLDGKKQTVTTENTLTLNTSTWKTGVYVVYLEAKDSAGKYYSYTAQVKVE